MKKDENVNIRKVLDILKINTDTDNMKGIRTAQEYYKTLAEKMGFEARLCAKDANGKDRVVEIRPKGEFGKAPKLGLVVHLDTVPIEDGWTHNPYGEVDKEGRVYGRGVIDDKAPAIETLQVMRMLKDYVDKGWTIICGSSEEKEWVDMEAFLEEKRKEGEELPDFSITIDGDGVQNGCRGYVDLNLSFPKETSTNLISSFGTPEGAASNSVPGLAYAVIQGEKTEAIGKACHSSIPQNGVNALIVLAEKLKKENPEAYAEYSNFFKLMEKMGTSFDSSETLFFDKKPSVVNGQNVGYTSSCPTVCEIREDKINVNLNLRLMAGTTEEEVKKAIEQICKTYKCEAKIAEFHLPAFIPMDNPSIVRMLDSYEETLGKTTTSEIAGGVGYNAALPRCAIFGPRWAVEHDEEDTCHAADESRTIKDIVTFMNMLIRFVDKEIPNPELKAVKEKLVDIETNPEIRSKMASLFRNYTPSEVNEMTELFVNDEFTSKNNSLQDEQVVINGLKEFRDTSFYKNLTPEQLSFVVNEILVSKQMCDTNLSLEEFVKLSPVVLLSMNRYNDEETTCKGLAKDGKLNDIVFLDMLKSKLYSKEEILKLVKTLYGVWVDEKSYTDGYNFSSVDSEYIVNNPDVLNSTREFESQVRRNKNMHDKENFNDERE